MTKRHALAFLLALPLLGGIPATGAFAANIKVLVNNEPITSYDIAQRVKLMQLAREKGGEKRAIDTLIDETLQLQEGKKRGLVVPDAAVDRAYASIADNMKLSPGKLTSLLGQAGVSDKTFKRRIKAQMTWGQLVSGKMKATTKVKSSDITAALLAKNEPSNLTITEYKLQPIIFVLPDNASPALKAQRRREAEAFRGRFKGCDQALEQARQLKGVVVKEMIRKNSSELDGPFGDGIKATPVGKLAKPNDNDKGIELIAVCDAKQIQSDIAARRDVESKLMEDQNKGFGDDYLAELRKAAVIENR